jgi:hypothetical protein
LGNFLALGKMVDAEAPRRLRSEIVSKRRVSETLLHKHLG